MEDTSSNSTCLLERPLLPAHAASMHLPFLPRLARVKNILKKKTQSITMLESQSVYLVQFVKTAGILV